ncbi:MAG: hypothetical protein OXL41_00380 [Nitrospinae bacterium]|nr:hypothetical protein [Nitrospinota bacterium]
MANKFLSVIVCVLLAAASAPTAWAHTVNRAVPLSRAVERPDGYRAVVDELRAWNLQAAREKIKALEAKSPGLAEWLALSGAADYLEGRYAESLANLNTALKKRPGDSEWLELRLHVRQTKTALEGFKAYQTEHFDIWYEPGEDAVLLPYLGDTLEKAYTRYGEALGVRPTQRIRVELFSDSVRFHRSSTLSRRDIEEKGAVGVCKFNKVMFLSPGALLRGYRWLDTAAHEYVHYLIVLATKNRAPIWLHEGIAKYLEKKWRGVEGGYLHPGEEALLYNARKNNDYVPFKKMEPSLIYLDTPQQIHLAYAEAASAVDFIHRKLGERALVRMLAGIRDAPPPQKTQGAPAFGEENPGMRHQRRASLVELESTGPPQSAEPGLRLLANVDLGGFEKLWIEDLKKLPLREHAGSQVSLPKLKPKGPMSERSIDLAALKSEVARRRMRLGDRLSFRGRMRAALIEYRRALRDEPNSQPLLNRAAQIEIHLGMIPQAERHIQKALEVDPDYAMTHVHHALASELGGKAGRALRAWEEVLHINPFIRVVHERLLAHYERTGETDKVKREREALRILSSR